MGIREWVDAWSDQYSLDDYSNGLVVMDGFDDCIVGIVSHGSHTQPFVVYDREKVIRKLMERGPMSREDAEEYHEYNQVGAWVGSQTPGFIQIPTAEDLEAEIEILDGE